MRPVWIGFALDGFDCFVRWKGLYVSLRNGIRYRRIRFHGRGQKLELVEGDIISFYDNVSGHRFVNSHRIVEVWGEGNGTVFITQGDKADAPVDETPRRIEEVIGRVSGHTNGIGKVFQFIRTTTGFVVCIILPCLVLLGYCIYDVVRIVLEQKKAEKSKDKERLKEELLEELRAEGKIPTDSESRDDQ